MSGEPNRAAGHRALPHTADVILEAWAPTREACIVEAVAALVDTFIDTSQAHGAVEHPFRIPARTARGALVAVLEEALYLLDVDGRVPVATTVANVDERAVSGAFVLADVTDRALTGSVPKGISLSGLVFTGTDGQWRCRCTVDV